MRPETGGVGCDLPSGIGGGLDPVPNIVWSAALLLGEFIMVPNLYRMNQGDIFSVSINNLSTNLDILNSGKFKILEIKQIRPRWYWYCFHHRFSIPKPYKIWVVKIMSV